MYRTSIISNLYNSITVRTQYLLLGMIMIVAYAGGVITFLVSTEGGHVFLWGVLLVATGPPSVKIMNGPLAIYHAPTAEKIPENQQKEMYDIFKTKIGYFYFEVCQKSTFYSK